VRYLVLRGILLSVPTGIPISIHYKIFLKIQYLHWKTSVVKKYYYQVQEIRIVDTRETPLILEPEKGLLTLLTCFPFDAINAGSPFRYRVDAILLDSFTADNPVYKL